MAGEPPYQPGAAVDIFSTVVAVHWEEDKTILDFVHDRYMVRGKMQKRAEVLEPPNVGWVQTPVSVGGTLPSEGWGLDLRNGVGPDGIPTDSFPRVARLRNKTAEPNRTNPGALNEFTFLDATVVIELDYFNDSDAFYATVGGFDPYDNISWNKYAIPIECRYTRTSEGSPDGSFFIQQAMQYYTGPEKMIITIGESDFDFWTSDGLSYDAEGNLDAEGTFRRWDRHILYSLGGWPATTIPGEFDTPPDGSESQSSGDYVASTGGAGPLILLEGTEPPPGAFARGPTWDFFVTGAAAVVTKPSFAAYDGRRADVDTSRTPRSTAPWETADGKWHPNHLGAYPAPYGRVRIAANVTAKDIAIAANGGDPVVVSRASDLQIPRLTPGAPVPGNPGKRSSWFPVATGAPFFDPGAEVRFEGFIRIRYVRLYRKPPRKNASLKQLSVVPSRIKKWWVGS